MESEYILKVILQRPEVRNAINHQMMQDLLNLWQNEVPKQAQLRCIILTGAGDKAFCAGADLKERLNLSLEDWRFQHLSLQQAMLAQMRCAIPIIAAVNGAAFGGGLELALACDFIYAAKNAVFSQSEVKLGLMPGAMGSQNLPKAAGLRRAKELAFTGESFSADQALSWNIVNKVLDSENLLTEALKTAQIIAGNAPLAVRNLKKSINDSTHLDYTTGYQVELLAYQQLLPTEDRIEGIKAFNEKRKAYFKNK
ncbi:MAG: enoyl-CoA hydratase/isomerase family protein [Proteobacteria bacterium]|nr:enoyl-CoA hydratase/isomerase family protein [Pseudomonadota bacterium]